MQSRYVGSNNMTLKDKINKILYNNFDSSMKKPLNDISEEILLEVVSKIMHMRKSKLYFEYNEAIDDIGIMLTSTK